MRTYKYLIYARLKKLDGKAIFAPLRVAELPPGRDVQKPLVKEILRKAGSPTPSYFRVKRLTT